MTQKEKQLLLKDLCARLPYAVRMFVPGFSVNEELKTKHIDAAINDYGIKPYLRPMSSMTAEELSFYNNYLITPGITILEENLSEYLDWMHSHHFDYRGLIPMGLALEAKEDMYKTE